MADDSLNIAALVASFRRKLAAGTLTAGDIEGYADQALASQLANSIVMNLTMEGQSGSAVLTCEPGVVLAACEQVLAEQGATDDGTGATHFNLCGHRVET